MKTAILLFLTLGLQSISFANSSITTCHTADNSIVFDSENFAAVLSNEVSKSVRLMTLKVKPRTTNKEWEFTSTYDNSVWATITVTAVGHSKLIASGGGEECPGGNKPSFETYRQRVTGTLGIQGTTKQIELICIEASSFHGDCKF